MAVIFFLIWMLPNIKISIPIVIYENKLFIFYISSAFFDQNITKINFLYN